MINREDLLAGTRPEVKNRVLVTEKESFEGYQVMDYKGVVWGISMRAKDAVQDFAMGCKNVTGGELTSYTELSDEVRQKAWDRMVSSATRVGANAIINFRFEITPVTYGTSGTAEVIAYGNAVVIQPIKNYVPMGGLGNILAEFVDGYLSSKEGVNSAEKSVQTAQLIEKNGIPYAVCPNCKAAYRIAEDDNTNIAILGYKDIDSTVDGIQIFCTKCGTKFTIPKKK